MIANEISLKKILTYTSSVYDIKKKFKRLERNKFKNSVSRILPKTTAITGAKLTFLGLLCFNKSINELNITAHHNQLSYKNFFNKREYIPKMHGLRDCIIDTPSSQIENINYYVINKLKDNKVFKNNLVDGLCVCAWDGVELNETSKNIDKLPEREHKDGEVKKYIKYLCAMNIGERADIMVGTKQMLETEKVPTKASDLLKAKTIGETTAFTKLLPIVEKRIGRTFDVHVMDALFLKENVMNLINKKDEYFVIRMEDKTRIIYQDAKGLFEKSAPSYEYETVEVTENIKTKYSKQAKHKDKEKTKIKTIYRKISNKELGEKILIEQKNTSKKNSIKETTVYEKITKRVQVWSDTFEYPNYKDPVRVIRCIEKTANEKNNQEIYLATNMLNHDVKTIIKIMHLRWHIENRGFRKLKQQYDLEHIYIGELNAINYMFQMIILVSNLLELYFKFRVKNTKRETYSILKKIFEFEIFTTERIGDYFMGVP